MTCLLCVESLPLHVPLHQNTRRLWHSECERPVELHEDCDGLTRRIPFCQEWVLYPLLGLPNLEGKFAADRQLSEQIPIIIQNPDDQGTERNLLPSRPNPCLRSRLLLYTVHRG